MSDITSFIDSYRIHKDKTTGVVRYGGSIISEDVKPSHTNIIGGSYLVPNEKMDIFYEIYVKTLESGKKLNLLEVPRKELDYGVVRIDFDFKYPKDLTKRQYNKETVKNIVHIYRTLISKYFDVEANKLNCFVTERLEPYKLEDDNFIRDGFHLFFNIGLPYSFQHIMRNMVIETIVLNNILDGIQTVNSIEQIVDKSVIETNNWFMYGSRKPNLEPYLLTLELDNSNNEIDVSRWNILELVKTLSIRKDIEKEVYKSKELEEEILKKAPIKMKITPKLKEKKIAIEKKFSEAQLPENYEYIKSLVDILLPSRAEEYRTWFEIGACLYNINNNLLGLWIDFSKKSSKFKDGECEAYWYEKFKKDNLSIASLIYWAKIDNPIEYEKIRRNSIRYKLETSVRTPTHFDIALVVFEMYKHQFVCSNITLKKWYRFNGHHWEVNEKGMCIRFLLSKEIANEYLRYANECNTKIIQLNSSDGTSENENLISGLQEKVKAANKIASCLKTTSFKDNVLKECGDLFYDPTFINKLDSNPLLIGVKNGVYDLSKREFRDGRPDDYVSKKTNIDYIDLDVSNKDISKKLDFINDFFNKILPIEPVRKYMWLTLSSCLEGYTDAKFPILTGTGGNGKTILLEFLQEVFGEYACSVSTSIFTHKSSSPSAASPEIARIRNVRLVSAEETEEGSTINVARMKELTGGNKITTRKLFEDIEEFKPQAHWFLVCNNLPKINSDDGGTWRRIHIVEFISSFVDNPDNEQYSGIPYVYKKDTQIGQKLLDCREVFFSYLVNVIYPEYKKNGIEEPKEVFMKTNAYRQENDIYFQYIKERIEKKHDNVVKITELYGDFKHWFKDCGVDTKIPSQKEVKNYFEKKFGAYGSEKSKNAGWKGISIIPKEIDLEIPAIMDEKDI